MDTKKNIYELIQTVRPIEEYTIRQLARTFGVSYSTARTALRELYDEGKITRTLREADDPRQGRKEWAYFRKGSLGVVTGTAPRDDEIVEVG